MRRHYSTRDFNIKSLRELYLEGRLRTDTAYQRGRVWKDREKHYLIDSLARGLPIGMITLFGGRDEDGLEFFEVIDGKQRVTTIIEFLNSEFELPRELANEIPTSVLKPNDGVDPQTSDVQNDDDDVMKIEIGQSQRELLQGQPYLNLKSSTKKMFEEIFVPAFVVMADKRHLAIDIFVRMNKNVKGLVPQEIRNAVYHNSQILKSAASISQSLDRESKKQLESSERWFCRSGFMKTDRFDRQADIQFILELLALKMYGPTHRRDRLDLMCDDFIQPIDARQKDLKQAEIDVREALKKIASILDGKSFKHFAFPQTTQIENDIYALVGAFLVYRKSATYIDTHKVTYGAVIRNFRSTVTVFNELSKGSKGNKKQKGATVGLSQDALEQLAHEYSDTYLGGQTNAEVRRRKRIDIWTQLLESVAPSNDKVRTFTPTQKALIWALSPDKKCAKCNSPIVGDKWDAGHKRAHADNGPTDISNGQIECPTCNRSNR